MNTYVGYTIVSKTKKLSTCPLNMQAKEIYSI